MNVVTGFYGAVGIYLFCAGVSAQYFDDPTKTFVKMSLDLVHRGSFNNTDCLRDLLNCWEIIKPDHICSIGVYRAVYESVCGVERAYCHEGYGWQPMTGATLHEAFCDQNN